MKKLFNKLLIIFAIIFPFISRANVKMTHEQQNRRVMEILNEMFSKDSDFVYQFAYMSKEQMEVLLSEPLTDKQYIQLVKLIRIFIEAGINFEIKRPGDVILATQDFKAGQ